MAKRKRVHLVGVLFKVGPTRADLKSLRALAAETAQLSGVSFDQSHINDLVTHLRGIVSVMRRARASQPRKERPDVD